MGLFSGLVTMMGGRNASSFARRMTTNSPDGHAECFDLFDRPKRMRRVGRMLRLPGLLSGARHALDLQRVSRTRRDAFGESHSKPISGLRPAHRTVTKQ